MSRESLATEQRLDPEINALINYALPKEELDKIRIFPPRQHPNVEMVTSSDSCI